MDISDKLLSSLEVSVEPFAICDVRCGYHLDIEPDDHNTIHYMLAGKGRLVTGDGKVIPLQSDEMILLPSGVSHRIQSLQSSTVETSTSSICLQPSADLRWLKSGEGATDVILACGRVHVTYGHSVDVFSLLAEPLIESFRDSIYIRGAFEAMLVEFSKPQLGTLALASTLMKQCLILLLRRLHEQKDWRSPWLTLLDNPRLENPLRIMLDTPEKSHNVEELAELACMSRSSFTEHFTRAFGLPPHEFLTNHRLRRAAQLLMTGDLPIKNIADKVGYQSRSSFSRAFKLMYSIDPTAYRKKNIHSTSIE
jgi:AraC-like DNA-binding protein